MLANGEVAPGLWYSVTVDNNFSTLGITAKQLNRNLATGGTAWWMPTTQEFGPNGSYDDWDTTSPWQRDSASPRRGAVRTDRNWDNNNPENTQVRLVRQPPPVRDGIARPRRHRAGGDRASPLVRCKLIPIPCLYMSRLEIVCKLTSLIPRACYARTIARQASTSVEAAGSAESTNSPLTFHDCLARNAESLVCLFILAQNVVETFG